MRRSLGWCLQPGAAAAYPEDTGQGMTGQRGEAATYTRTGTGVAFIIPELPGERAEALFIAVAAVVPTAGEQ